MAVFWDVAPCSLVEIDRRFRGQSVALMMEAVSTSESSVSFYRLLGATAQKTAIFNNNQFTPDVMAIGLPR
jgi:hypothetical protein